MASTADKTDPRFTDARTPTAHAASHALNGSHCTVVEAFAAFTVPYTARPESRPATSKKRSRCTQRPISSDCGRSTNRVCSHAEDRKRYAADALISQVLNSSTPEVDEHDYGTNGQAQPRSRETQRDTIIWALGGVLFALVGTTSLIKADAWYLVAGACIMLIAAGAGHHPWLLVSGAHHAQYCCGDNYRRQCSHRNGEAMRGAEKSEAGSRRHQGPSPGAGDKQRGVPGA
jgi:hypothetical protein